SGVAPPAREDGRTNDWRQARNRRLERRSVSPRNDWSSRIPGSVGDPIAVVIANEANNAGTMRSAAGSLPVVPPLRVKPAGNLPRRHRGHRAPRFGGAAKRRARPESDGNTSHRGSIMARGSIRAGQRMPARYAGRPPNRSAFTLRALRSPV